MPWCLVGVLLALREPVASSRLAEDAWAFIDLVGRVPDLHALKEPPEIARFPIVRTRFANAREIIRLGRTVIECHGVLEYSIG